MGVEIRTEVNGQMATPMASATAKPRITSPPKMAIATKTKRVVADVLIVRDNVEFNASFIFSQISRLGYSVRYSLILSKITTVSFKEYPMMVRMAAMNCWSISSVKGNTPVKIEKKETTKSALKIRDISPPIPQDQFLNLAAIYRKMATQDSRMAMTASRCISLATVGPTFSELMIPLGLSSVERNYCRESGVSKNSLTAL